jgi:hypothetical protein
VPSDAPPLGYDQSRQEGLVLERGGWVAVLDARGTAALPGTIMTEVSRETTDNE